GPGEMGAIGRLGPLPGKLIPDPRPATVVARPAAWLALRRSADRRPAAGPAARAPVASRLHPPGCAPVSAGPPLRTGRRRPRTLPRPRSLSGPCRRLAGVGGPIAGLRRTLFAAAPEPGYSARYLPGRRTGRSRPSPP